MAVALTKTFKYGTRWRQKSRSKLFHHEKSKQNGSDACLRLSIDTPLADPPLTKATKSIQVSERLNGASG